MIFLHNENPELSHCNRVCNGDVPTDLSDGLVWNFLFFLDGHSGQSFFSMYCILCVLWAQEISNLCQLYQSFFFLEDTSIILIFSFLTGAICAYIRMKRSNQLYCRLRNLKNYAQKLLSTTTAATL